MEEILVTLLCEMEELLDMGQSPWTGAPSLITVNLFRDAVERAQAAYDAAKYRP
jgi:hypothetical protein